MPFHAPMYGYTCLQHKAHTFPTLGQDIYQMECFPLSVHGNESFMKRLQLSNSELFHECVENYPTCALLILRSGGVSCICTMARHCQELSSICRRTMRVIGRVVMPKFRNTCSLCNRVNSDLVQNRILFCNATDDCRKKLWETIIELKGHSHFQPYALLLFINSV